MFQYRDKRGSKRSIYEAARDLAAFLRDSGSLFIVNDHADIAVAVGADGVHLGQDDLPLSLARKFIGPERIIGISTHSREQAVEAERGGATYVGFGPLFRSGTKDAGPEQGTALLAAVCASVNIPVVAIGGIGRENAQEVLAAGADGIAVITAILRAPDVTNACRTLQELISLHRRQER